MQDELDALTKRLLINFKDKQILEQVFYHRSYLNEIKKGLKSNERLEFLGDSVLSLVTSVKLYNLRKEDAEGDLTNLRAYIVKTDSLGIAAKKLNLGKYLKLSRGEEIGGGRENPQLLANTYEALLGATYLDQGLDAVLGLIERTLFSLFEKELKSGPPKDSKSNLQEVVQEKFRQSPHYKITGTSGPDHAKQFTVAVFIDGKNMGQGTGPSKQDAEELAAKKALEKLEK